LHGRLSNDPCLTGAVDYASYGDHLYSDKAPGLSLIELPSVAVLQPGSAPSDHKLWGVRIFSVGVALLVLAFLVGRVSEGLAPGFGGVALVVFALGTMLGGLASISFEHVPAALFAFSAFLLAWKRRPFLGGLVSGLAVLTEYETGLICLIIGCYVALGGLRPLSRYVAGVLPGGLLLGLYDWAAFGAPWHLSYRYVGNTFSAEQSSGFFGISAPRLSGLFAILAGNGGLLFASPVLAVAVVGLIRFGRTRRAEALTAGAVVTVIALANAGYYLPYGGSSPGPRFLATSLPFLALGLGPALAWRPRLTLLLSAVSIFTSTAISLVYPSLIGMQQTVWGELTRIPRELGRSRFVEALSPNVIDAVGLGRNAGALLVAAATLAAFVVAARTVPWSTRHGAEHRRRRLDTRMVLASTCIVLLFVAVDASSIFAYPYGDGYQGRVSKLRASITSNPTVSYLGGEVVFAVTVSSYAPLTLNGVEVTIQLDKGMALVAPPKVELGSGCTGTRTLHCDVGYLTRGSSTMVLLNVQMTEFADETLVVTTASNGFPAPHSASYRTHVGR
jgi:hypothetical protein